MAKFNYTNIIVTICTICTVTIGALSWKTEERSRRIDEELKKLNIIHEENELQTALSIQAYRGVMSVLEKQSNPQKQWATYHMIKHIISDYEYSKKLLSTLAKSTSIDKYLKDSILHEFSLIDDLESDLIVRPDEKKFSWANSDIQELYPDYLFDVFYFEENFENSRAKAKIVFDYLQRNRINSRLRMISIMTNKKISYRIKSNQIRCKGSKEKHIASTLVDSLVSSGSVDYMKIKNVITSSDKYISLWVYN